MVKSGGQMGIVSLKSKPTQRLPPYRNHLRLYYIIQSCTDHHFTQTHLGLEGSTIKRGILLQVTIPTSHLVFQYLNHYSHSFYVIHPLNIKSKIIPMFRSLDSSPDGSTSYYIPVTFQAVFGHPHLEFDLLQNYPSPCS